MKSTLQAILSIFILCISTLSFAGEAEMEEKIKIRQQNIMFMLTVPEKSLKLIKDGINRANHKFFENNFDKKKELTEITNDLEKCLSTECYKTTVPIYFKKVPFKAIVMRHLGKIDDLILENESVKLTNIKLKAKKADDLILKNSQNENDINKLKLSLKQMSNDNNDLRKKIDIMIAKYIKKIDDLKKDNDNLNNKFNTAYEMLSGSKKKKLDKILTK